MRRTNIHHHDSSPRGVFITGTDTGVGKTLVTAALVSHLRQRGIDIGVMKPVETGVARSTRARSDGARLRRAAECHDPMTEVSPYVFRLPMAPLSAARAEQQTIRLATILRAFHALCQKHDFVAVEGAGGIHVPITNSIDGLDLIQRMGLPVIVVGRSGLGGINHALLTLHALRQRKINVIALVLNQPRPVRTKIARMQEQSTLTLLQHLANIPVVGPVPYRSRIQQNWNDGMISLAWTVEIMTLAKLVTASGRENS
ncbi:MAG: dethiobiotin synthase [Nitrospirota bacterium]|nr:dethiobiotin synthase [Nitrospirota bacterium]MDP3595934.1 dethiobiotin synthase [Nitrospirota bacterium]